MSSTLGIIKPELSSLSRAVRSRQAYSPAGQTITLLHCLSSHAPNDLVAVDLPKSLNSVQIVQECMFLGEREALA